MIPVQLFLIAALAGAMSVTEPVKPGPRIMYTVTIDSADLSGIDVVMQISGAPRTIRLAMAVHPEYNDRFWRYIRNLRADYIGKPLAIAVEKENAWRMQTPSGEAIVRYRIQLPPENPINRAVWHTALRADGASINSTDTFLYVPDFPRSPVEVAFNIPESWQIRSALPRGTTPVLEPQYTIGGDATTLLDSPILLGALRTWSFAVGRPGKRARRRQYRRAIPRPPHHCVRSTGGTDAGEDHGPAHRVDERGVAYRHGVDLA